MRYLKTYENHLINENLVPDIIKSVINKIGDMSLLPKVTKAIKNLPKDVDSAFNYLCQLFNVNPDKEGFLKLLKRENRFINESFKDSLRWVFTMIALFLVYVFFGSLVANSYEDETIEFLKGEGYEDIKIISWSPIAEREEDITAIDFEAFRSSDSSQIEGVVIIGGSILLDEENFQVKIKKRKKIN